MPLTRYGNLFLYLFIFITLAIFSSYFFVYSETPNQTNKNVTNSTNSDEVSKWWLDRLGWLLGIMIPIIVASLVAIFRDAIKAHFWPSPRPNLSIDPNENPSPVRIRLPLIVGMRLPQQTSNITATYLVNRIIVSNNGNAIASNCKGLIRVNDQDLKVCWDD